MSAPRAQTIDVPAADAFSFGSARFRLEDPQPVRTRRLTHFDATRSVVKRTRTRFDDPTRTVIRRAALRIVRRPTRTSKTAP